MTTHVNVTMTETVTYEAKIPISSFAELIDHEGALTPEAIKAVIDDPNNRNGDTGVDGADALLDYMIEPRPTVALSVSERDWEFTVS